MNKKKLDKYMSILLMSVFLITSLTGCIKKESGVPADDQSEIISNPNNDEENDSEDSIYEESDSKDLTHEIPYEILRKEGNLKDNDGNIVVDCNVKYLQLKNIYNKPYIDSLNEEIRKRAEDKYNDNMNVENTDYEHKYEVTVKVTYARNGIISFVETSNYDAKDAAIEEVEGYTYSLKDEKKMDLSDILVDAEGETKNIIENEYKKRKESSTEEYNENLTNEDSIKDLTIKVSNEDLNDIGFYLNEDELVFLIPVFALNRPHAAGNDEIPAPSYKGNYEIYKNFGQ